MLGNFLGGPWGSALGGLGSILGANSGLSQARDDILGLANTDPTNFTGAAGTFGFNGGNASFGLSPQMQAMQNIMSGVGAQGFGGGLFSDPAFQQAFQQADLAGAFNQAQQPIDTGFLGQQGRDALLQAQDQSGLIQGFNDQLTALARPGENAAVNRLLQSQFDSGMGASSPAADERASQANRFRTDANDRARIATQLGMAQQQALRGFGTQAIGQGFNQGLTSGQTRLQNALGLFGLGDQLRSRGISEGFQSQAGMQANAQHALSAILGSLNAGANRASATGYHANQLGQLGQGSGGLLSGAIGSILGGFS